MADVARVLVAAAGEDDGEVRVVVVRRIAEVAGEEDRGAIEKCAVALGAGFEFVEELAKDAHLGVFDERELLQLAGVLAVMRGVVVADVHALNLRLVLRAEPERNGARAVGLKREMHEVIPLAAAFDELRAAELLRRLHVELRLWRELPGFVLLQLLFGLADGGDIQVEALAVLAAEFGVQAAELVAHIIENALPVLDAAHFARGFVRGALDEELLEDAAHALLRRKPNAAAIPCRAAAADDERVEARLPCEM